MVSHSFVFRRLDDLVPLFHAGEVVVFHSLLLIRIAGGIDPCATTDKEQGGDNTHPCLSALYGWGK